MAILRVENAFVDTELIPSEPASNIFQIGATTELLKCLFPFCFLATEEKDHKDPHKPNDCSCNETSCGANTLLGLHLVCSQDEVDGPNQHSESDLLHGSIVCNITDMSKTGHFDHATESVPLDCNNPHDAPHISASRVNTFSKRVLPSELKKPSSTYMTTPLFSHSSRDTAFKTGTKTGVGVSREHSPLLHFSITNDGAFSLPPSLDINRTLAVDTSLCSSGSLSLSSDDENGPPTDSDTTIVISSRRNVYAAKALKPKARKLARDLHRVINRKKASKRRIRSFNHRRAPPDLTSPNACFYNHAAEATAMHPPNRHRRPPSLTSPNACFYHHQLPVSRPLTRRGAALCRSLEEG